MNIKKFFEENIILKIVSLFLAIGAWFYIIVIVDPPIDVAIRDIPIQFLESNHLTVAGLSVVNEAKNTLEIKIRGSRKIISKINNKNIVASVNLSSINKVGERSLPIELNLPYNNEIKILSSNPATLDLIVDESVQKSIKIEVNAKGELRKGLSVGETKVTPAFVNIKGISTIISTVEKAVVNLNYKERDRDVCERQKVILYNKQGDEVNSAYITKDVEEVDIFCQVFGMKTVPVVVNFPANSRPDFFAQSQKEVTLWAQTSVLENVQKIETEIVPLDRVSKNNTVNVKLLIPDGVAITENIKEIEIDLSPHTPAKSSGR